jgi:hypothetical protein
MDAEIVIWTIVFIGGYSVILGWFLRIALSKRDRTE